ncbi:MAG: hypothetical protein PHN30_01645 [Bacteroidales bacterium]|jgi:hypothetical protein|nr:hypothetical protein [Bacteroidales bacterium]MDD2812096.1 hypothetical protein [Bacteroidales bacterium]MDD3384397.1 hypothetical protein [Bacteroidales bacterium]MDD3811128.1 hypothetical protein [Bacteroidales bacterium]MDD3870672.1 hypothetical protein [Bacteroidales bacterium]
MYIKEILWLLTWPLLIAVAYYLIRFALKKFEKHLPEEDKVD